jgi:LytS/YehU family sensor histidine kinase
VKHAVARSRLGAQIRIQAEQHDGHLRISVCDDGPGFEGDPIKPGHGLDLLRQRILILYGPEARLCIAASATPDCGARVELHLPHHQPAVGIGATQDQQS